MTDLITKSSEEIMTTLYKPTVFVVDGLFAQGLYLLAGSPKVGKSWLALELCLAVAKGEKFFDRKTLQGSALYFCLEDSYQRIQNRLYELTDDPSDKLFFALKADTLGSGLEEQIALFKSEHPDLCLVVIDTLQMVRNETESSYGSDYADLLPLKGLAQQLGITMILVHHLRKAADSDPFNMISGSNGLSGCSDGQLVLRKSKRCGSSAVLYATGRDIGDQELELMRVGARWELADEHKEKPPDIFPFAVHDLMVKKEKLSVTATELSEQLNSRFGLTVPSNMISKELMQHGIELQGYGVTFELHRSHGKRWIELSYDRSGDSGDGRMLYLEDSCPAGTRNASNVVPALIEQGDGSAEGDSRGSPGDSKTALGDGTEEEYSVVYGKKYPIVRYSLDDIIHQSAAKIRAQIYKQKGILVPEFSFAPQRPVCPSTTETGQLSEKQTETPHSAFVSRCGR